MKIRKATIKDIEGIKLVYEDYEKASRSYLPKKYLGLRNKKKPIQKNLIKSLSQDIKRKDGLFLVAEHDGMIVGYIYGMIRPDDHVYFKPAKTGELNDIAVKEEFRGRGISSKLWNELHKWFKIKKCKLITLGTNSNNTAQEIYKKWGFEVFYLRMIREA